MNAWVIACVLACLVGQGHSWTLSKSGSEAASMMRGFMQPQAEPPAKRKMSWGFEFYNWGSQHVKKCPPNVVFVVDGSDSVSMNGFRNAKEYLKREIRAVTSSFAHTDVGVIFFSNGIFREMPLTPRSDTQMQQLYNDIDAIEQPRDRTELRTALARARQVLERHKMEGNVIVVISDGCPYNLHATVNEALLAWMEGIFIISLGIEAPQISLQKKISSRIQHGNTSIDWSEILICPAVMLPGIEPGTNCRDFMFVVDGSDSVCDHQEIVKRYLKSAIHRYENVTNAIGVTVFGTEIGSQAAPNTNKDVVMAEIKGLHFPLSGTKTTTGIIEAQRLLDQAGRTNQKGLVLITDGPPLSLANAINAVDSARDAGYEIIVIGVGDHITETELLGLAGGNNNNMFSVDTFVELYTVDFSTILCGGSPPAPRTCDNSVAGCINGNAVTDSFGNCVCVCNPDWSGTTCNNRDCAAQISCLNGGSSVFNSFTGTCECNCPALFSGTNCEISTSGCQDLRCDSDGTSLTDHNSCRCACRPLYSGPDCSQRGPLLRSTVSPTVAPVCRNLGCSRQGTETEDTQNCVCICKWGYSGSRCQRGPDPRSTRAPPGQTCTSLYCSREGTESTDVENCKCKCKKGFSGDSCRIDQRVQTTPKPDCRLSCYTPGTRQRDLENCICQCRPGFAGERCQNVQSPGTDAPYYPGIPCQNLSCRRPGTIKTDDTNCRCVCRQGYSGNSCQIGPRITSPRPTRQPTCRDLVCDRTGTRIRDIRNCVCDCLPGYSGSRCQNAPRTTQTPIGQTCTSLYCSRRGTRIRDVQKCRCSCKPGFSGDSCQFEDRVTQGTTLSPVYTTGCNPDQLNCDNRGLDRVDTFQCRCICKLGYSGVRCENAPRITSPPVTSTPVCDQVSLRCDYQGTDRIDTILCRCQCRGGYSGSRCETAPITPVATTVPPCNIRQLNCDQTGTQSVDTVQCRCLCKTNYSGPRCETAPITTVPPCNSRQLNCDYTGTQSVDTVQCRCVCKQNYSGTRCEKGDSQSCGSVYCNPAGTYDISSSCQCLCRQGYSGTSCQQGSQSCGSVYCNPEGTSGISSSCQCQCRDGFSGQICEPDNNRCLLTCQYGALIPAQGSTPCSCSCNPGYTGATCDTCAPQARPCENGGFRTPGANCLCACPADYTGTYCESLIDRCAGFTCMNGGTVINTASGCSCRCTTGFSGSICDRSLDPCAGFSCSNGGTVIQTGSGSCGCRCPNNFVGDRCDCPANRCGANGQIIPDTCSCNCNTYFAGPLCDVCDTTMTPCVNGYLVPDGNRCRCVCNNGYTGTTCNEPVCTTQSQGCINGGQAFTQSNGQCACQCPVGTSGLRCETVTPRCSLTCLNGGTLEFPNSASCRCRCTGSFIGDRCETRDCRTRYCDRGDAFYDGTQCRCQCRDGYTGDSCNIPPQICTLTCLNNGYPDNQNSQYCNCVCVGGYTGDRCQNAPNDPVCPAGYCLNGATQVETSTGCECICLTNFSGTRCENDNRIRGDECPNAGDLCIAGARAYKDCNGRCLCDCPPGYGGPKCEIQLKTELCDDCKYGRNGIGYTGVEERCDLFVRCEESQSGGVAQQVFECPPGTLWDQTLLVCNHPDQVTCKNDFCRNRPFNTTYGHFRECQAFWRCANGRTAAGGCCNAGEAYDPDSQSCVPDSNCPETCSRDATSLASCGGRGDVSCPLKSDPSDPRVFYKTTNDGDVRFECGTGTVFSEMYCVCVHDERPTNRDGQCGDTPTLPLEFNGQSNASFKFENIQLVSSDVAIGADVKAANFTGNSRVYIHPFAHSGFHYDNFVVRVRFNTAELAPGSEYVILSNGDCNVTESLAITVTPSSSNSGTAYFKVTPEGSTEETAVDVNYNSNGWVTLELSYMLNDGVYELTGRTKGSAGVVSSNTVSVTEKIGTRMCPVQIGQGLGYRSFVGFVDWVRFWMNCKPSPLV